MNSDRRSGIPDLKNVNVAKTLDWTGKCSTVLDSSSLLQSLSSIKQNDMGKNVLNESTYINNDKLKQSDKCETNTVVSGM